MDSNSTLKSPPPTPKTGLSWSSHLYCKVQDRDWLAQRCSSSVGVQWFENSGQGGMSISKMLRIKQFKTKS